MITTVADPGELTAAEVAGAYAQRWEHETALGEVKSRLLGAGTVLSSQSPPMVTAQVYGILLAHYAVRSLMCQAADGAGYDSDRMGFTHAVRVVRRTAQGGAVFSPDQHRALRASVVAEIAERPNPPRRHRSYPRRVKRARHNSYRVKHPADVGIKHQRPPVPVLIPAA